MLNININMCNDGDLQLDCFECDSSKSRNPIKEIPPNFIILQGAYLFEHNQSFRGSLGPTFCYFVVLFVGK